MPKYPYAVPLVRSYSDFHARNNATKDKSKRVDLSKKKQARDYIILTDEHEDKEGYAAFIDEEREEDSKEKSRSSAQSTPVKNSSPGVGKKRWTEDENATIVDHFRKSCDRAYLQAILGRPKTSIADQVQRILRLGLEAANKTATK